MDIRKEIPKLIARFSKRLGVPPPEWSFTIWDNFHYEHQMDEYPSDYGYPDERWLIYIPDYYLRLYETSRLEERRISLIFSLAHEVAHHSFCVNNIDFTSVIECERACNEVAEKLTGLSWDDVDLEEKVYAG